MVTCHTLRAARLTSMVAAVFMHLFLKGACFGSPQPLTSTHVAGGFTRPVFVTHAPGDFSRLFVVEQPGRIRIIKNGVLNPISFLDVSSIINATGLEYGLLMLTFHPNYQQNGFFYAYYTVPAGVANPVVARFRVTADPDVADFKSRTNILHIPYNIGNHRAGWMGFGPDDFLYITTGDGGETDPQNNASNLAVLKGKVLRIDVNGPDGQPGTADDDGFPLDVDRNYCIPADNPFLSKPGAALELWAYGLRNPWRASMDRLTHDLWIGDVGQGMREEVDFQPSGVGGLFYGWKCREGSIPTNYTGCPTPDSLPPSTLPIHEYTHAVGASVIGGYVYRGCAIPWLQGKYVFGDWGGKIWSMRYSSLVGVTEFVEHTAELAVGSIFSSFGEDAFGELYVTRWSAGDVRKIVSASFIGPDCNGNGRNDACDVLSGSSADNNSNGVPDECDPPRPDCPGDANRTSTVDIDDLVTVITQWGLTGGHVPGDVTHNGMVDIDDLVMVITNWGACR